ncbi:polyisoprenoid-binding protein YceI [Pseudonocardia hierapolitana]|uniref:Polyisoprenoid-binding protein YceI n=1 Tax=Pseudonocardia hierapolitana TaxID=1128676 RepID=A0A561SW24_9PSEU|nr:YceI family protein [Pseudonocardia hierapolitana]TWF79056.1 polyisoprenoid-binding protein YceI [Pseudonocardia hierapolitana]
MQSAPGSVAVPDYRAGTWKADPAHSEIAFSVRHLMISKVRGRFTGFDVTIVTSEDPMGSSATATIDLASVDTGNETRDNHLRSAEFLDVEKHPTMSYRSTGIRRADDGWIVDGDLTLHGVTRAVPLTVEMNGFAADPWGGQRAGFSASAQVNRRDFGVGPTVAADGGGVALGEKVSITLEIQAVLQEQLPPPV